MERTPLIGWITAAVVSCVTPASAAKFVYTKQLSNPDLRAGRKAWQQISRGFEDTGSKTVRIVARKPGEKWPNTVKQVLWGQYVEGVSAAPVKPTRAALAKAVNAVFDSSGIGTKSAPARAGLTDKLFKAVKSGMSVYSGGIWGAFDMDYAHLTIHDKAHGEMLSIYAGYSE